MSSEYNFADNLKAERVRRGLSQEELASKLGVTKSAISLYEVGKISPTLSRVEQLADVLGVTVSDLVSSQ